jgi:hypothetical protein
VSAVKTLRFSFWILPNVGCVLMGRNLIRKVINVQYNQLSNAVEIKSTMTKQKSVSVRLDCQILMGQVV